MKFSKLLIITSLLFILIASAGLVSASDIDTTIVDSTYLLFSMLMQQK